MQGHFCMLDSKIQVMVYFVGFICLFYIKYISLLRSIGCGLYPSLCLLNTCCDQNITKYYSGTTVVGLVSKPIKAGEEVSDNYFPTAVYMEREKRRTWLRHHYMFDCECEACHADLPLVSDMSELPVNFLCQMCQLGVCHQGDDQCSQCGGSFDFEKQNKSVINLTGKISACVDSYKNSSSADPEEYYLNLQHYYAELRSLVTHPFKFLVFAEQQYLIAMKQTMGNRIISKK